MAGSPTDTMAAVQVLPDNAEQFAARCDRCRSRIWRIVSSVSRSCDAEDLAQETVVRAYAARRTYREEAPFEAWLCRIAVNVAHDHRKSAWVRRVFLMDRGDADRRTVAGADEDAAIRERQRRVRSAVAALPEPERIAIWLHYFEGFGFAEISRLESAPESTIRSRVKSGHKRLCGVLADLVWDEDGDGSEEATTR